MDRELISVDEIVSVDRVRMNLRLTDNSFDDTIRDYIHASIMKAETKTGLTLNRSMYSTTMKYDNPIEVNVAPVLSYKCTCEGVDVPVTMENGVASIPSDYVGKDVTFAFEAGFVDVPADIKMAIIMMASALFLNPVDGADTYLKSSDNILKMYRIWH